MEPLTPQEIEELRRHPALYAGWVFVSSLAMRTFRKTPLLKRWCEVRTDDDESFLEFYRDKDDFEPTKRFNLNYTRVVVSEGRRFTEAQTARMPSGGVPVKAKAFYIDFPLRLRKQASFSSSHPTRALSPFFETRSMRAELADISDDFPLGFIMVAPDSGAAMGWEQTLLGVCHTYVPRESKRERVQRWMNRAWMRIRGDLSIDQFDESFRPTSMDSEMAENFFSIGAGDDSKARDVLKLLTASSMDSYDDSDASEKSFQTAGTSSDSDTSVERHVMRNSFLLDNRRNSKQDNDFLSAEGTRELFTSVEEMLREENDERRHCTPISLEEIESAVEFVEGTRRGLDQDPAWSLCSSTDTFDCFKSIDEKSGVVRTRTCARISGVAPQTLFHILYDNDARKAWDHHYARFDTIWRDPKDPCLDILDAIVSAPLGCANREFLEWRRRLVGKGRFVIFLRSWSGPDSRPVLRGNVRADVWMSAYLIQWWRDPTTGELLGTDVMVMTQIDIKGLIPKYLVNALSNSAPKKWVKGVTTAATKEIESRGLSDKCLHMSNEELDSLYGIIHS